ncbi:hypothetical protein PEAC54167_09180 [Pediococcus acidilactici]|jgi:hypothetical protein|uniref:Uncharacterized protein n=1 Tax=Pediococcus acidilactici TaxID=1254 RepID=A0AAP3XAJ7_PEDAC|nr:hypothetical protein [Pediococcus acidilactici]APR27530.1 hypothetical protein BTW26_00240 [Pediococcus acidilactici]KAF0365723.1 hypothetical protein GBO52_10065 [Pediococcus acidilactici]KAF0371599.1 hypothetical protein GBO58_07000 [Pediococcus acidilactici]KAF0372519.1 hypothetical protein GBO60_01860 [Pediococcus acidilactici]KAF0382556.1 hypothetical protein GBO62_06915 [Pediococcus acidilactici]
MDLTIIKKYIATYLSSPTTRLTTVNTPRVGIKVVKGDEETFFYPNPEKQNAFFEEFGEHRYLHQYDAAKKAFTTQEL